MMTEQIFPPDWRSRPAPWWAFACWAVAGLLVGLGLASLLTIGLVFLLVAGVLVAAGLLLGPLRNRSAVAVPAGLGLAMLYLAWLNRGGPGRVCETTGSSTSCAEAWNPWPFLVIALLLLAATVLRARLTRP